MKILTFYICGAIAAAIIQLELNIRNNKGFPVNERVRFLILAFAMSWIYVILATLEWRNPTDNGKEGE